MFPNSILKSLIALPLALLLISALEADFSFAYWGDTDKPDQAVPFSKVLVQRQKERFEAYPMNKICRALKVRKNMVILDIGTGSGQYAYGFAKALQGTGEVFATDINPDMVNYVRSEAKRKHLKNLIPVLVKAGGADDFYSSHKYDLIFLSHVLEYIPDSGNYLRKMKKYLSPEGHLILLTTKSSDNFDPKDFTDVNGLLRKILSVHQDSPFYKYVRPLQPEAGAMLAAGRLNRDFLIQLARRFNAMAHDGHFFVPFLDKKKMALRNDLKIPPQERVFINFNLSFFKEFNVQDEQRGVDLKSPHLNLTSYDIMVRINHILIISEFQGFMYGGKSPYLPGGKVNREIRSIKNKFEAAGYRFVQAYDFIPNELLMEFSG